MRHEQKFLWLEVVGKRPSTFEMVNLTRSNSQWISGTVGKFQQNKVERALSPSLVTTQLSVSVVRAITLNQPSNYMRHRSGAAIRPLRPSGVHPLIKVKQSLGKMSDRCKNRSLRAPITTNPDHYDRPMSIPFKIQNFHQIANYLFTFSEYQRDCPVGFHLFHRSA